MIRYLCRRLLSSVIALFLFLTLMFFVAEIMIPTDFTTQFAMTMNREARAKLKEELGIDQPLWRRYLQWMGRLLQGNLGTSFRGRPVGEIFESLIPYTLFVFFTGTVIAFQLGKWLGKVVAWRGPGILSGSLTFTAVSLYTTFPPWLTFLITYFFARQLDWFTSPYKRQSAFSQVARDLWADFPLTPEQLMLAMLLSFVVIWLAVTLVVLLQRRLTHRRLPPLVRLVLWATGVWGVWQLGDVYPQTMDVLSIAGLPVLTYVLLSFGETMLIMRTSMMDTLKEDYIVTAEAKGLSRRAVRDRHAARNALLPVFSRLAISFPYMLTGLVIIETVLEWPGISSALFDSLYNQDMPVVMGGLLIVGVVSVIMRLALDLLYLYLDPRIRYQTWKIRSTS